MAGWRGVRIYSPVAVSCVMCPQVSPPRGARGPCPPSSRRQRDARPPALLLRARASQGFEVWVAFSSLFGAMACVSRLRPTTKHRHRAEMRLRKRSRRQNDPKKNSPTQRNNATSEADGNSSVARSIYTVRSYEADSCSIADATRRVHLYDHRQAPSGGARRRRANPEGVTRPKDSQDRRRRCSSCL